MREAKFISSWVYFNTETGEIRDMQSTKARGKSFLAKLAREKRDGRRSEFTNANMRHIHEVSSVLTTAQCGYLMLLQCYIDFEDGKIINSDKSTMTTADMRSALQLNGKKATFYDFLNDCLTNDIIRKCGDYYCVNKRYHFKGALSGEHAIKAYSAKLKRVYSEVKASDIGLIYRMLPLVHMGTNALCDNAFERDPKKVRWLNLRELSEAVGVDARYLGRRLKLMKFDGEYVVARIKLGSEPARYTINPSVFYRQDKTPDDTLMALFNVL